MDKQVIRDKIIVLINDIVGDILQNANDLSEGEKLSIILSESMQALIFVTSLEDEFKIQFDDDQIDLEFFQDIDETIDRVYKNIMKSSMNVEEFN
jgi:acyl carrier protein